jgi:thiol-disulfide isomerase/thioredoxin
MKKILTILFLTAGISSATYAQAIPDFTMDDTHGNSYTLFDVLADGNEVILDFFATWCGPCKSSTPALQGIWSDWGKGAGGLYVFGIDVDQNETDAMVDAFKQIYGPNADYPGFTKQQTGAQWSYWSNRLGSTGIPTFVMLSPNVSDPANSTLKWSTIGWGSSVDGTIRSILHPSTVGINEISAMSEVLVYPNPALNEATIEFNLTENQNMAINVYDVTGKLVQEIGNTNYSVGNHKINFDGSNLESGLYYINIISDNGVVTSRLMLNK